MCRPCAVRVAADASASLVACGLLYGVIETATKVPALFGG
jgi:hypothetical protein